MEQCFPFVGLSAAADNCMWSYAHGVVFLFVGLSAAADRCMWSYAYGAVFSVCGHLGRRR